MLYVPGAVDEDTVIVIVGTSCPCNRGGVEGHGHAARLSTGGQGDGPTGSRPSPH